MMQATSVLVKIRESLNKVSLSPGPAGASLGLFAPAHRNFEACSIALKNLKNTAQKTDQLLDIILLLCHEKKHFEQNKALAPCLKLLIDLPFTTIKEAALDQLKTTGYSSSGILKNSHTLDDLCEKTSHMPSEKIKPIHTALQALRTLKHDDQVQKKMELR